MIRGGRIIQQQVVLPAEQAELYTWFTDAGRLASWMSTGGSVRTDTETTLALKVDLPAGATRIEPEPGGYFRCVLPDGQEWQGVVVEILEPHRLVITLGWADPSIGLLPGMSLVEWDLAPDPKGTRLRLRHEHVPNGLLELHNDTWARLLARLRKRLQGRFPGPHPLEGLSGRLTALRADGDRR